MPHEPAFNMNREEIQYRILRLVEENPQFSQRDLAAELGVSLGSAHYCLKALVEKGWIKAGNFAKSPRKTGYLYQLTPSGISNKAALTRQFLKRKREEYCTIQKEIAALEAELTEETSPAGVGKPGAGRMG